jgi:membrane-associated protein
MVGYWFGNVPAIKNNLSVTIVAIVVVSLIPAAVGWWRQRRATN